MFIFHWVLYRYSFSNSKYYVQGNVFLWFSSKSIYFPESIALYSSGGSYFQLFNRRRTWFVNPTSLSLWKTGRSLFSRGLNDPFLILPERTGICDIRFKPCHPRNRNSSLILNKDITMLFGRILEVSCHYTMIFKAIVIMWWLHDINRPRILLAVSCRWHELMARKLIH